MDILHLINYIYCGGHHIMYTLPNKDFLPLPLFVPFCENGPYYDFITIDGGMLVHSLPGTSVHGKSFDDYFSNVFCPRIHQELKRSTRVDIVWDQYRETSIRQSTREKRGTGTRQRVSGSAKVPKNWPDFLASAANKTGLFSFLATRLAQGHIQYDKCLYITSADEVLSAGPGPAMGACNHEEADIRVFVHVLHALQHANVGLVFTGDTDVVVILLSNFHHIAAANPAADIWIAFKTGKSTNIRAYPWTHSLRTWDRQHARPWHYSTRSQDVIARHRPNLRGNDTATNWRMPWHPSWKNLLQSRASLSKCRTHWMKRRCHLSVGYTLTIQPVTLTSYGWMSSARKREMPRGCHQRTTRCANIPRGVFSRQASGLWPTSKWCQLRTPWTMDGWWRTVRWYPSGSRSPLPRTYSNWTWSVLVQQSAPSASVRKPNWSAHACASADATSEGECRSFHYCPWSSHCTDVFAKLYNTTTSSRKYEGRGIDWI